MSGRTIVSLADGRLVRGYRKTLRRQRPYSESDLTVLRRLARGEGGRSDLVAYCTRTGRPINAVRIKILSLRCRPMSYEERKRWEAS